MNRLLAKSMIQKEIRAYFLSPVALIFIATFLLASLFAFFWIEGFFGRNMADIRPLFQWLPILLIFLVPALGMRLWSEEEQRGTLELLRTLPLSPWQLVSAKFIAGLAVVATAVALTLPVPMTVQVLGDLDWGPVLGGYLATLLLAGAYLALTLCVSASTPNQIVALAVSALLCGALHILGSEQLVALFGVGAGELLRSVSTGARFVSIVRGVLDVRDLAYYASLIGFFLFLNVVLIEAKAWSRGAARRPHRTNRKARLALVGANLLAFNVLLAPAIGLRLDLTEQQEYSVSEVTRELLHGLDEPLTLRGYFSTQTHPLLAPLVPRIRDLLQEYGAIGGDNVTTEFINPADDPALEKEARQSFGIESVPFQFADRHAASVVNSYFHVLVRYGDQFEVLAYDDLIEVQMHGMGLDVRLRNVEYDVTRAIQKVVYGFQSLESLLSRLPDKAHLTAFVTRDSLPAEFAEAPSNLKQAASEIAERSGGRFTWTEVDPDHDATMTRALLHEKHRLQPMATSLFADKTFFFHLLLQVGAHEEPLIPTGLLSSADLKKEIQAALGRLVPGALKTVGWAGPDAAQGRMSFRTLREFLGQTYKVEDVETTVRIPAHVDVLLVVDARDLSETDLYNIDQFVMRGGRLIVAAGSFALDPSSTEQLMVQKVNTGLQPLLDAYGIATGDAVVLDRQSAAFPIPVTRDLGGYAVREIQMLQYPAFVEVRGAGLAQDNPAVSALPRVIVHWTQPVSPKDGAHNVSTLLASSDQAWLLDDYQAHPNLDLYPDLGWPQRGEPAVHSLAVTAMGPFTSMFKAKSAPKTEQGASGGTLESSPSGARVVVLGSANLWSDFVVELERQLSDAYLGNIQLAQNLIDWTLEDVALLQIRSRGSYARILAPISEDTRKVLEVGNYCLAVVLVILLGVSSLNRRKLAQPITGPGKVTALPVADANQKKGAA
jgi:ABC-2 type transport system permease protein